MSQLYRWVSLLVMGLALGIFVGAAAQQKLLTVPGVTNVIGLAPVKDNEKGTLTVEGTTLRFASAKAKAEVPISSIQDVLTGEDSARAVGGALGTLSMLAPYGGGRFLSLFRKKIDTLTLEYRDENGALHGVILTMPAGQAAGAKKWLLALGAHTSVPVEESTPSKDEKEKKQ